LEAIELSGGAAGSLRSLFLKICKIAVDDDDADASALGLAADRMCYSQLKALFAHCQILTAGVISRKGKASTNDLHNAFVRHANGQHALTFAVFRQMLNSMALTVFPTAPSRSDATRSLESLLLARSGDVRGVISAQVLSLQHHNGRNERGQTGDAKPLGDFILPEQPRGTKSKQASTPGTPTNGPLKRKAMAKRKQLTEQFVAYSALVARSSGSAAAAPVVPELSASTTISLHQWLTLCVTAGLLDLTEAGGTRSLNTGRIIYDAETGNRQREANFGDFRRMLFRMGAIRFGSGSDGAHSQVWVVNPLTSEDNYMEAVERVIAQPVARHLIPFRSDGGGSPRPSIMSPTGSGAKRSVKPPPRCYGIAADVHADTADGIKNLFAMYSDRGSTARSTDEEQEAAEDTQALVRQRGWLDLCEASGLLAGGGGAVKIGKARMCGDVMLSEADALLEFELEAQGKGGVDLRGFRRALSRMAVRCCGLNNAGTRRTASDATGVLINQIVSQHSRTTPRRTKKKVGRSKGKGKGKEGSPQPAV
jgi:hypothetical protein